MEAAVASDVRGEYTRSAPPFVCFHSHRGDKGATHALTGCAQPLPAATTRAAGLLTKVGSDLDAACGAVGAAVATVQLGISRLAGWAVRRRLGRIRTVRQVVGNIFLPTRALKRDPGCVW